MALRQRGDVGAPLAHQLLDQLRAQRIVGAEPQAAQHRAVAGIDRRL
ncbi:hypothetical protein [Xanthomonas translucens]|nr:hypothetical protein [Xanthomonas translucens]